MMSLSLSVFRLCCARLVELPPRKFGIAASYGTAMEVTDDNSINIQQ